MSIALDLIECPLDGVSLVEASAGTGKTWSICGLYARLLLERRMTVQDILVVTFTHAATAELRDRIRRRLQDLRRAIDMPELADDMSQRLLAHLTRHVGSTPSELALALDRALLDFDAASITTIHGFCQRALGDVPLSMGQPLQIELQENDDELRAEVAHALWQRHVASVPADSLLARTVWADRHTVDELQDALRLHAAKPCSQVCWPADPPVVPSSSVADQLARARPLWDAARITTAFQAAYDDGRLSRTILKPASFAPKVHAAAEAWTRLLAMTVLTVSKDDLEALALFTRNEIRRALRKGAADIADPFPDVAQEIVDALRTERGYGRAEWLRCLRSMIAQGLADMATRKEHRRIQSFDDLLGRLRQALSGPGGDQLAQVLRKRFPAALIDEFQDTDPVQYEIFSRIYAGSDAPLFLVGDPKQAIYSFRNADLRVYLLAAERAAHRHALLRNFRSSSALIDGLNTFFGAARPAFLLRGLNYERIAAAGARIGALVDASGGAGAALQFVRWPAPTQEQPCTKGTVRTWIAEHLASEVARLLTAADAGRLRINDRPVVPGDIAVLVRTRTQGRLIKNALRTVGVGSVELTRDSVFATAMARELAQVLRAVTSPGDPSLLRTALATQIIGLTATDLEDLAHTEQG
ncbi:MAG TPA: UvrD-helicase domain-containing protein, partial [Burkholderiaceae bacterium]|nr:UvrD-helicase domain-containing protein [Burkholderiaceae bacterium]